MKKVLIVFAALLVTATTFAQSERYTKAMTSNLQQFDSANTPEKMLSLSAAFERIADAEKTQWLPYYYAALCESFYAFMKNDPPSFDTYADKTESLLNKADELEKNNSEISCLKSMVASMRLLVDPQQRWQTYGTAVTQGIENAKKQDPANPRPYFLEGQNLRYTPEQFGGGCATAAPKLEAALKKYESFKPASALHPDWGKEQVEQLLAGCK